MYSCAGEKHVVLVLCDVHCFRAIDLYYYYLVFRSVYVHFNDIILNWHQVYSIGGATHIHNLNYCPRVTAFRCKKAAYIEKSYRRHELQNIHACFNQVQPQNGQLDSFFGLRWFVVVCLHFSGFTVYRPKFWW